MERGLKNIIEQINTRNRHWLEIEIENGFIKGERPPQPRDYFYAGWAGQCPRYVQTVMKAEGPFEHMKFRQRKAFEYGTCAHERYQNALKLVNPNTQSEVVVKFTDGEVSVSGKIDIVIVSPSNSLCVVEFKTINGTEFKTLTEPKYDHLCQWTLYAHHLKTPAGLIVYENKDDAKANGLLPELKIFEVKYSEELYQEIITTFRYILACFKDDSICDAPEKCPNYFCELKCKKGSK
jgi:hypothetical protein